MFLFIIVFIYLSGCVTSVYLFINKIIQEKKLTLEDLFYIVILSFCSWVGVGVYINHYGADMIIWEAKE